MSASFEFVSVAPNVAAAAIACGIRPETLGVRRALPEPAVPVAPVMVASDLQQPEWDQLRKVFPAQSNRRNGRCWRTVLNGVLYLRVSKTRWSNLPRRYGNGQSLRKAMEFGAASGLFHSLLERIDNGELAGLGPERLRQLRTIAADWTRKGDKYARQRTSRH